jgi:hypothetical protein
MEGRGYWASYPESDGWIWKGHKRSDRICFTFYFKSTVDSFMYNLGRISSNNGSPRNESETKEGFLRTWGWYIIK